MQSWPSSCVHVIATVVLSCSIRVLLALRARKQQSQNSRLRINATGQYLLVFCASPENPTVEHYCEQRSSVFAIIAVCCEMLDEALQLIVQSLG